MSGPSGSLKPTGSVAPCPLEKVNTHSEQMKTKGGYSSFSNKKN